MSALLELRNVETYYGPIMAIRGVSLEVRDKQIVTLLGANGAGKTTVLKTISGAMDPQKGTVTLAGEYIQRRDPDAVARLGVAHVPEGREIFPFLSVDENLRMGAFSRHDDKIDDDIKLLFVFRKIEFAAAIVNQVLDLVGSIRRIDAVRDTAGADDAEIREHPLFVDL